MEKETLEEAGERLYPNRESFLYRFQNIERKAFTTGAKWQAERMYSEEDVKSAYEQGARLALLSQSPLALHKGEFPNPEEWFNQYKEENNIWK